MKKVEMTFQFEDDQYEMLEEEAKSLAMTVEELMANTFSVILHEIQDDVAATKTSFTVRRKKMN